jgi:hypothetical protein
MAEEAMKNVELSKVPDQLLIDEVYRRLRRASRMRNNDGEAVSILALPEARNACRQNIARSLLQGNKSPWIVELLRFLADEGRPLVMKEIKDHLHRVGYGSRTFYDPCNALCDVGFAERCYVETKKAWRITAEGVRFLEND